MKPKLTIIRGLPGSGKSTYAKDNYNCLILENDMFHIRNGVYKFDADRMPLAIDWCMTTAEQALRLGMDVVVANTFTKKKYLEKYQNIALWNNADFEVVRCIGDYGNIHHVPQFVLENMERGFEDWEGERLVGPQTSPDMG